MRPARQSPVRRRGLLVGAAGVAVLGLLQGCGSSPTVGPSGVDELEIPTPSPDPADFVAGVGNRWFPGELDRSWVYLVREEDATYSRTVTVEGHEDVAGVTATEVRTVEADDRRDRTDLYAQDRDGNVWWLGSTGDGEGEWRAGRGDARAGLVMAADPRLGDGYRAALAPGRVEDVVSVVDVDGSAVVDGRLREGLLVLVVTSPLRPAEIERRWYAAGVGLVRAELSRGGVRAAEVELVDGG